LDGLLQAQYTSCFHPSGIHPKDIHLLLDTNILSFIANSTLESSERASPWIQLLLGFIQEKLYIGKVCMTNTVQHELLQYFPPEIVDKYHIINVAYWNPQVIVKNLMHAHSLKGMVP
jgi:hypothetical protein